MEHYFLKNSAHPITFGIRKLQLQRSLNFTMESL